MPWFLAYVIAPVATIASMNSLFSANIEYNLPNYLSMVWLLLMARVLLRP